MLRRQLLHTTNTKFSRYILGAVRVTKFTRGAQRTNTTPPVSPTAIAYLTPGDPLDPVEKQRDTQCKRRSYPTSQVAKTFLRPEATRCRQDKHSADRRNFMTEERPTFCLNARTPAVRGRPVRVVRPQTREKATLGRMSFGWLQAFCYIP